MKSQVYPSIYFYVHFKTLYVEQTHLIPEGQKLPSSIISSFEMQIIAMNAHKLLDIQLKALPSFDDFDENEDVEVADVNNSYAILLLESRENWIALYEAMLLPNFIDENDKWDFYYSYEGEFPTTDDLKKLKGIIIVGGVEVYFSTFQLI